MNKNIPPRRRRAAGRSDSLKPAESAAGRSDSLKSAKNAAAELARPFTRGAGIIIIVFLTLVSGFTVFFVYGKLEKETILRASMLNRAAAVDSASRVENALMAARADALTLLGLVNPASGSRTNETRNTENLRAFFKLHPEFAALVSNSGARFVNETFFLEHGLNENTLNNYLAAENELVKHTAVMEKPAVMLLGNPSPYFNTPLIALFFCGAEAGWPADDVFAAFFSSAGFTRLLESEAEKTFMVNGRDDILLHTGGVSATARIKNYWQEPLVRLMRQTGAAEMELTFTGDNGAAYTGAFCKIPSAGGAAVLSETGKTLSVAGILQTMREIIVVCGAALAFAVFFCVILSRSMNLHALTILRKQEKEILERERLKNIFRALPENLREDAGALEKFRVYGEDRALTAAFVGVRGFREYAKNLSPRKTLEALNSFLTLIVENLAKTGGAADKIAGDTVTEFWGAPVSAGSPEMDALNAVRGALILRAALPEWDDGGTDTAARPLICCGINSGYMIAGVAGPENRREYTFTGDAVKRARLLEALNKRFGTDILISEYTLELAGKYFITEELPPVKIRGSKKPLRVFAVINVKVSKTGVKQPKPTNLAELRQMLSTQEELSVSREKDETAASR
jgi:adenylate cyclase